MLSLPTTGLSFRMKFSSARAITGGEKKSKHIEDASQQKPQTPPHPKSHRRHHRLPCRRARVNRSALHERELQHAANNPN